MGDRPVELRHLTSVTRLVMCRLVDPEYGGRPPKLQCLQLTAVDPFGWPSYAQGLQVHSHTLQLLPRLQCLELAGTDFSCQH